MAKAAHVAQDFEMSKVTEVFNMSWEEVKKLITKFKKLNKSHDGMLTIEEQMQKINAYLRREKR